jgi:hypothetical protein
MIKHNEILEIKRTPNSYPINSKNPSHNLLDINLIVNADNPGLLSKAKVEQKVYLERILNVNLANKEN